MRFEVGVATDIGKVRKGNEDSYLVQPPLYAVADGMGGARGGEVASNLALETVEELFREGKGTLADQVRQANRAIHERSIEDATVSGMGTTLTAVQADGPDARLVHVGDSRGYLLRAGAFRQLTKDHTLVARMVKAGEISQAEADVHPHRNVLTRALGTEANVKVDEDTIPLLDGDRVLLCSDGLTSMVAQDQIQAILEAEPDPQRASDRLIKAALRAGGVDNITVLILDAHGEDGDEIARGGPRGPRWGRWIAGALAAIVILVGSFFAFRAYVDRQWYVGVADDHVAVYRGLPAHPLGISLSNVETTTDIPAQDAEALQLYVSLPEGIAAESRDDAFAIVEQIRKDVEAAAPKPPKDGGSGTGGGSGGGSGNGGDG
jgi:serine/threonine protein phosphatase PrpC